MPDYDFVPGPQPRARRLASEGVDRGGSRTLFAFVLGLATFLFVAALSAYQVTRAAQATHLIEAGVASTTETDLYLAEHAAEIRALAATGDSPGVPLPGFPLDVLLTREEAINVGQPGTRDVVVERSAAVVYHEGIKAFDRTGEQSIGIFSSQGALRLVLGRLTEGNHRRAGLAAGVFAAVAGLMACGVVLRGEGWARLRALGLAIGAGGLACVVVFGGALLFVRAAGGGDVYTHDLRQILEAILETPVRNGLVVAISGVVVAAAAPTFALAERRLAERRPPAMMEAPIADEAAATLDAEDSR